jgi:hypothetical protein
MKNEKINFESMLSHVKKSALRRLAIFSFIFDLIGSLGVAT